MIVKARAVILIDRSADRRQPAPTRPQRALAPGRAREPVRVRARRHQARGGRGDRAGGRPAPAAVRVRDRAIGAHSRSRAGVPGRGGRRPGPQRVQGHRPRGRSSGRRSGRRSSSRSSATWPRTGATRPDGSGTSSTSSALPNRSGVAERVRPDPIDRASRGGTALLTGRSRRRALWLSWRPSCGFPEAPCMESSAPCKRSGSSSRMPNRASISSAPRCCTSGRATSRAASSAGRALGAAQILARQTGESVRVGTLHEAHRADRPPRPRSR